MASFGSLKSAVFDREERKMQYQSHVRGLNALDRHKRYMNDYDQGILWVEVNIESNHGILVDIQEDCKY